MVKDVKLNEKLHKIFTDKRCFCECMMSLGYPYKKIERTNRTVIIFAIATVFYLLSYFFIILPYMPD